MVVSINSLDDSSVYDDTTDEPNGVLVCAHINADNDPDFWQKEN